MSKKIKLEIRNRYSGDIIFEYESENNTMAKTVEKAIEEDADLRSADLSSANLRYANLRYADLSSADLRYADLRYADLRSADLRSADLRSADLRSADLRSADLRSADLRDVPFNQLPEFWVNLCSRDILFVLEHLANEVPFLKDKLIKGEVDGTQYEGDCACLIGTLGNAGEGKDKVCSAIPYYTLDSYNPGEQWFLQIKEGDTPNDNVFAEHAVKLCNRVLGLPENNGLDSKEVQKEEEKVTIRISKSSLQALKDSGIEVTEK